MQILMQPMGRTLRPGMRVSGGLTTIFQLATLDLRFAQQKTLDPRITFTRASSGTYVGSDGLIKTATTNLLLRSEEFENASWTKSNITISSNSVSAPNGTVTADTLTDSNDGAAAAHSVITPAQSFTSGLACTISVYAQAGSLAGIAFVFPSAAFTSNLNARFNISTGTIQNLDSGLTGSITEVGGGWYRCSATATATATASNTVQIRTATASSSFYQGNGTGTIFLWGAQLEANVTTPGEYIPTTSVINSAPRFDHNPTTGESLGLLVEEQRTNSIRNNTMVGAVAGTPGTAPTNWSSDVPGLTREIVGTGTEAGVSYIDIRLSGTTSNTYGNIFFETNSAITASNGQAWAHSLWLRIVGGSLSNISTIRQAFDQFGSSGATYLSTITSTLTGASSSWVRYIASLTTNNASVDRVRPSLSLLWSNGSAIDITLRIGLPQLEQGAFATSVIPTTTATVTRSADVASITGTNFSSWYRQDEGTFYGSVNPPKGTVLFGVGDTFDNAMYVTNSTSSNVFFRSGASDQATLNAAVSPSQISNIALGFQQNNFAACSNGGTLSVDTSGNVPVSPVRLKVGSSAWSVGSGNELNGTIRRLTYWPRRLGNEVLQEVTR